MLSMLYFYLLSANTRQQMSQMDVHTCIEIISWLNISVLLCCMHFVCVSIWVSFILIDLMIYLFLHKDCCYSFEILLFSVVLDVKYFNWFHENLYAVVGWLRSVFSLVYRWVLKCIICFIRLLRYYIFSSKEYKFKIKIR